MQKDLDYMIKNLLEILKIILMKIILKKSIQEKKLIG